MSVVDMLLVNHLSTMVNTYLFTFVYTHAMVNVLRVRAVHYSLTCVCFSFLPLMTTTSWDI